MTSAGKSQRLMIKILTLPYFPHTECGTHTTPHITHHMPRIVLEISADLGQWCFKTRWMEFLAGWLDAPNKSPPEMHPDSWDPYCVK